MQQPLAIMVIGGLTANMLFTRMVIPVGYLILERTKRKEAAAPEPATAPVTIPPTPPSPEPESQESTPTQELTPLPHLGTALRKRARNATVPGVSYISIGDAPVNFTPCYRMRML